MKFVVNNLERFVNFLKLYHEDLIESFSKNPTKYNAVRIKILKESYIKNRQEILDKEFKNNTKEWIDIKCFYCNPYRISMWNDNSDEKHTHIDWGESIFDISIEKLSELMKKYNKKHLKLMSGFQGGSRR